MLKKLFRKQLNRDRSGFTLVEMLACVIIVTLVGIVLVTGINLAFKAYNTILFRNNSSVLEDSINTSFGGLLRNASNVTGSESDPYFTNNMYTATAESGHIVIPSDGEFKGEFILESKSGEQSMLVNKGEYLGMTVVWDGSISYSKTTGVFSGKYKIVSVKGDKTRNCSFKYKTIS